MKSRSSFTLFAKQMYIFWFDWIGEITDQSERSHIYTYILHIHTHARTRIYTRTEWTQRERERERERDLHCALFFYLHPFSASASDIVTGKIFDLLLLILSQVNSLLPPPLTLLSRSHAHCLRLLFLYNFLFVSLIQIPPFLQPWLLF